MLVPVKIKGIEVDAAMQPVLVLTDVAETRFLPIWIGPFEAFAIGVALKAERPERPLAYDLFLAILSSFEASVRQVVVEHLKNGVFYASLHVEQNGRNFVFDARPSDAVAMAVRTGAPIYVHRRVWETALTGDQLYGTKAGEPSDAAATDAPKEGGKAGLRAPEKDAKQGKIIDLTSLRRNKDLS
ncbi:MAG: hypothetical protein BLITH_1562 [Brockia lithotrophica]|uniref:BFN domain-containing protein n=1 Tax=Brockia lithotrophica TaxID=933949 RepID=A0A2T5G5N4_9BACL|nr:bifunctional nuclease family protein [Brockia lithotrophica]PTQ51485.1 MAG: hypothetical protein BLITH_1562 [Brockia lithotrophica]